jgi:hypothetical protein
MRFKVWMWNLRWVVGLLPLVMILFFKITFLHDSIKVQGVVTQMLYEDGESGASYPQVTFTDPRNAGVSFTVSPTNIEIPGLPQLGDKVEVYFDTKDPSQSRLNSFMEMWLWTLILALFSFFFIIQSWCSYWFQRTNQIVSDPAWLKNPWGEPNPQMVYEISIKHKVGFLVVIGVGIVCFTILGITGPMHSTIWSVSFLMLVGLILVYTFFLTFVKVYEKGFVHCRNSFWPIYQIAWDEIRKVEYKKSRIGMPVLIFTTETGKCRTTPNFAALRALGNLSKEQFIALIREKRGGSVLDESVLDWLSVG